MFVFEKFCKAEFDMKLQLGRSHGPCRDSNQVHRD